VATAAAKPASVLGGSNGPKRWARERGVSFMMIVVALFLTRRRPLRSPRRAKNKGVPEAYMYLIIERLAP
jgi:hypothetical protein